MRNDDSIISIAIVDDEALIVMLLSDYFSKQPGIEVTFTANDGTQLIDYLRKTESLPDIVLLDLQMKEMGGIDTTAILKKEFPDMKIIIVSSYYKKSFMGYMLKLGVNAFLPKGVHPEQLVVAIEDVYTKGYYFIEEQIEVMRNQISSKAPMPCFSVEEELSERETEILKLICQQYTAPQIVEMLYISPRTVEGHKSNLLLKTSARNLAGLVIYAVQKNIIEIDDFLMPKQVDL
jgi:DNA-binding NarL/FixJ family response regulator